MGQWIELTAGDGHSLAAWKEDAAKPKGAVIVLQEIFGVNAHIRDVAARFAAEGYTAVAPALFDRIERDFESGYSPDEVQAARGFIGKFDWDAALHDVDAARAHLAAAGLPVSVVGFCLGGSLAFLAATRLTGVASAVSYYGGQIVGRAEELPRCPTLLHFGATDHSIPMEDVDKVRERRPETGLHVYDAGHGFNCDARDSHDAASATLAWTRTLTVIGDASARGA